MTADADRSSLSRRLRRDLGTLESYAALLGILIGAGIFKVTNDAWVRTGPSVILGHLVLATAVLATSLPYAAFLSTPLGRAPGGEYTHLSRTFKSYGLAFVGSWLKIISYVGALAYLAQAFADYLFDLMQRLSPGAFVEAGGWQRALAIGSLLFFYLVHVLGVRWFGRVQVAMCALLGLSLLVLVMPGLFAVHVENYRPFFTRGAGGFLASLPLLFFEFAGFESLAQTAGEVKDSTRRLPRVFLRGIAATTVIYLLMSAVGFGVLPGQQLVASPAPMAEVASVYLPMGAAAFVSLGALMAITTSLNASMLVPSRLALILAQDRLAPRWMGAIHARTGTPVLGLSATCAASVLLLVTGQVGLALNIAVFALMLLYFMHTVAFLALPRLNPALQAQVAIRMPRPVQRIAAIWSLLTMGGLIAVQIVQDIGTLRSTSLSERLAGQSLTSLELAAVWSLLGALIYAFGRRIGAKENHDYEAALVGAAGPES